MKSVYGCIYGIWNPSRTKVYVGQTTKTPAERWVQHKVVAKANKGCRKLTRAIRKYGEQMIVEPLDVAECQEDLDFLEIFYICTLDAIKQGYNCKAGGGGGQLLDGEARERQRVGIKMGQAKMTDDAKMAMRKNNSASIKATMARSNVRARVSANNRAYWAREEKNGRVLRSPEERERRRLYHQKYLARREAEGRPYARSPEAKERDRLRCRERKASKRA